MILKVTLDDSRWDQGLTAVLLWWNTDIFCVVLTIRQNSKLVRGSDGFAGPVGCLKWALWRFGLGAGRKSCVSTPDKLMLTARA